MHELDLKVQAMAEALCERGDIESISRPSFAKACGIEYEALKTACKEGRLSPDLVSKLVEKVGFDPSDPSWIDSNIASVRRLTLANRNYERQDTAINFRNILRARLGLPSTASLIRVESERPVLADANLAIFSVDDSGQGASLGDSTPLFFCIVVNSGYDGGIEYGFQRVRLRLEFEEDSSTKVRQRLGHPIPVEIDGALLLTRGTEFHTEWFLQARQAILKESMRRSSFPWLYSKAPS